MHIKSILVLSTFIFPHFLKNGIRSAPALIIVNETKLVNIKNYWQKGQFNMFRKLKKNKEKIITGLAVKVI